MPHPVTMRNITIDEPDNPARRIRRPDQLTHNNPLARPHPDRARPAPANTHPHTTADQAVIASHNAGGQLTAITVSVDNAEHRSLDGNSFLADTHPLWGQHNTAGPAHVKAGGDDAVNKAGIARWYLANTKLDNDDWADLLQRGTSLTTIRELHPLLVDYDAFTRTYRTWHRQSIPGGTLADHLDNPDPDLAEIPEQNASSPPSAGPATKPRRSPPNSTTTRPAPCSRSATRAATSKTSSPPPAPSTQNEEQPDASDGRLLTEHTTTRRPSIFAAYQLLSSKAASITRYDSGNARK